jgi:hypothetical protein
MKSASAFTTARLFCVPLEDEARAKSREIEDAGDIEKDVLGQHISEARKNLL